MLSDVGVRLFKQLVAGKARGALILVNAAGSPWGKSNQARPFRPACTAARIVSAIAFHGLRHTWAGLAVMNGVPLLVVAKNLRHTDSRMVEKHYGHLSPSSVAGATCAQLGQG